MTLIAAVPAPTSVLALLAVSAMRALALSGVAALGLAAFRVKTTAVRLFTWTAVLYAALAMPLLQWMLPAVHVPTPAVLQFGAAQPPASAPDSAAMGRVLLAHKAGVKPASSAGNISKAVSSSHLGPKALPRNDAPRMVVAPVESGSILSSIYWISAQWTNVAAGIYFVVAFVASRALLRGTRLRQPAAASFEEY